MISEYDYVKEGNEDKKLINNYYSNVHSQCMQWLIRFILFWNFKVFSSCPVIIITIT